MSERPDVSLIMANYNGARHLAEALQSALNQTLRSWELILVDDASTDDSIAVARQAAGGDPRIVIIRQDRNRGPGAARNRALQAARGAWLAIFDSDDIMLPDRLETLRRRAEADDAVIIADNLQLFSDDAPPRPFLTNRLGRAPHWIDLATFIDSSRLYARNPDLGYLKPMIRADLVRLPDGGYDEGLRIGEDYNFLARLMAQGHRLRLEPSCLYLYRKHAGSVSHRLRAADIEALLDTEARFRQHAETLGVPVVAALGRRRRSLEALLAYDRVIAALKQARLLKAISIALPKPLVWPLLTRPVSARIRRLVQKTRLPARTGAAFPETSSEAL